MTEPLIDYAQRAGNRPRPAGFSEPREAFAHTRDAAEELAAAGVTFWADIAVFQPVVNDSYPYPVLGIRADSGWSTDSHAKANWGYAAARPHRIRALPAYVVFIPGQSGAIFRRLKNLFGAQCPLRVVPEIDMESGKGFAGPGNHSSEANDFAATLADWSNSQARVQGYANAPDWAASWSTRPAWMKRRLAYYSSSPTPAGFYARQYYGALPYGVPHGYPTSCAPFGSWVDLNVTPRTIAQIEADYGITTPKPPTPEEDEMKAFVLRDGSDNWWVIAADLSSKTLLNSEDVAAALIRTGQYRTDNPLDQTTLSHIPIAS